MYVAASCSCCLFPAEHRLQVFAFRVNRTVPALHLTTTLPPSRRTPPAYSSYFDSGKSEEEASKLPYNADFGSIEGLDPLALEMTELPRSSKVRHRLCFFFHPYFLFVQVGFLIGRRRGVDAW